MDSVDLNQFERAIEGRIADSELNAGCDGIPDGVRERFGSATWFQDSDYGKLATLDGLGEVFTLIGDVNAEKLILLTAGHLTQNLRCHSGKTTVDKFTAN